MFDINEKCMQRNIPVRNVSRIYIHMSVCTCIYRDRYLKGFLSKTASVGRNSNIAAVLMSGLKSVN